MSRRPPLAAVILAAGFSSRMGLFKPLLPLEGKTVIERTADIFLSNGISEIIIVLGHRAAELRPLAERAGAKSVYNSDHPAGMFSSLQAGVRNISKEVKGFFVHPGDMPMVSPGTVAEMVERLPRGENWILHPVQGGRRGHPPCLSRSLEAAILSWNGREGLRGLMRSTDALAHTLLVNDPGIHLDLDHREDYNQLLRQRTGIVHGPRSTHDSS